MGLNLPQEVVTLLSRLNQNGFSAFAVGGCVRDSLRGVIPKDWDVATNASPGEMMDCFSGWRTLATGERYGTVTVWVNDLAMEVTTFRQEGEYRDHRHPGKVAFTQRIEDDLARRDFTINAMAYHPKFGVIDPFGGQNDLKRQCIRCVGDPSARFSEDSLRILRGLRFACVLGFAPEQQTACAMLEGRGKLDAVSRERVFQEMCRMLQGKFVAEYFPAFFPLVKAVLPELENLGRVQETLPAFSLLPMAAPLSVRWALLFVHPDASFALACARQALQRLRCSKQLRCSVEKLVGWQNAPVARERVAVKQMGMQLGLPACQDLFLLQRILAEQRGEKVELQHILQAQSWLETIVQQGDCLSVAGLQISGSDLLALGIPQGPEVGRVLHVLLQRVVEGTLLNEPEPLRACAKLVAKTGRGTNPKA